ncbi:MAG TPA: PIN domain-containing protein [Gemmataceae bacterium]|nr:PIN domain-containing protein [Gemmataceae bacterium]
MADKAVLIETTILVDYLRRSVAAADYLDATRAAGRLICSTVTYADIIVGCRTRAELKAIDQLLARFDVEPIVRDDSVRALNWLRKYYHSRGVGYHDCLLGAAAVRRHLSVATLNEKHFTALPGVRVIRPY